MAHTTTSYRSSSCGFSLPPWMVMKMSGGGECGGGECGGGDGGGCGGGNGCGGGLKKMVRGPQSEQSVPILQYECVDPSPPSSHVPSDLRQSGGAHSRQSLLQTTVKGGDAGGEGGEGGDGGGGEGGGGDGGGDGGGSGGEGGGPGIGGGVGLGAGDMGGGDGAGTETARMCGWWCSSPLWRTHSCHTPSGNVTVAFRSAVSTSPSAVGRNGVSHGRPCRVQKMRLYCCSPLALPENWISDETPLYTTMSCDGSSSGFASETTSTCGGGGGGPPGGAPGGGCLGGGGDGGGSDGGVEGVFGQSSRAIHTSLWKMGSDSGHAQRGRHSRIHTGSGKLHVRTQADAHC